VLENNITLKQLKWVYYYGMTANATEAAKLAGYSGDQKQLGVIGSRNKKNPKLTPLIEENEISPLIADRFERQATWTRWMRDKEEHMGMRIQASKLLGQAQGDFFISKEKIEKDKIAVIVVPENKEWRSDLKVISLT